MKYLLTIIALIFLTTNLRGAKFENIKKYDVFVQLNSKEFNVDADLIRAIIQVESRWNPQARSKNHRFKDTNIDGKATKIKYVSSYCNGLMQVKNGSFEPAKNIRSGTSILSKAFKRFQTDSMSVMAYNLGQAGILTKFEICVKSILSSGFKFNKFIDVFPFFFYSVKFILVFFNSFY